jgi:hypothetical protein
MFMFMRCALLCLVCLGLSGCAIGLTSESTADAEGTVYYLPKSLVEITVVKAGKPESYTISAQGKSVPDLDHRYVLSYQPNVLYDDRFCIGRDADGLLTTVQFAAEDKTQQIVYNISRLLAGAGQPRFTVDPPVPPQVPPITFKMTIDPTDWRDVTAFEASMNDTFGKPADGRAADKLMLDMPGFTHRQQKRIACPPDEICFRTMKTVPVGIRLGPSPRAVTYVDVVNPDDMGRVSVKRALLVERVTKLWFDRGALRGIVMRKPSEALGLSMLPLNVVKAVLSTPSDLIAGAFGDTKYKKDVIQEISQIKTELDKIKDEGAVIPGSPIYGTDLEAFEKSLFRVTCAARNKDIAGFSNLLPPP